MIRPLRWRRGSTISSPIGRTVAVTLNASSRWTRCWTTSPYIGSPGPQHPVRASIGRTTPTTSMPLILAFRRPYPCFRARSIKRRKAGPSAHTTTLSTTTQSTRAATSPLGSSQSFSRLNCEQRSGRFGSKSETEYLPGEGVCHGRGQRFQANRSQPSSLHSRCRNDNDCIRFRQTFNRSAAAFDNPDHVAIVVHNYRWRLGLAEAESKYDHLERTLATFPTIAVPTITLESDANGAPHPNPDVYAKKFSGKYVHRLIEGGIGHNLPQEALQAFAQAVIDVDNF